MHHSLCLVNLFSFLPQLIHYMKRANFSALGEKVNFDQNGDPIAYYDLLNWQRRPDGSLHLVKVGFYDASLPAERSLVINDSAIQWPVGKVCSLEMGLRPCSPLRQFFVLQYTFINKPKKISPSHITYRS